MRPSPILGGWASPSLETLDLRSWIPLQRPAWDAVGASLHRPGASCASLTHCLPALHRPLRFTAGPWQPGAFTAVRACAVVPQPVWSDPGRAAGAEFRDQAAAERVQADAEAAFLESFRSELGTRAEVQHTAAERVAGLLQPACAAAAAPAAARPALPTREGCARA